MLKSVVWNRTERRPRAAVRLVLQIGFTFALCLVPAFTLVEYLAGLHRQGLWLADMHRLIFDKVMDFIAGPLFTILLIASILIGARIIDRRNWRDLGLRIDRVWMREWGLGLALGALLILLVFGTEHALGWAAVERRTTPGLSDVPVSLLWLFLVLKTICIGPSEEIVSRGYVLKNVSEGLNGSIGLTARGGAIAATLLTSILFAFGHFGTDNFGPMAALGLILNGILLAAPVLSTGRLGMSIGLHMSWNFTQGPIFGYPVSGDIENISIFRLVQSGPDLWTGGRYGPEGGLVGMLGMLIGIGLIALYARRRASGPLAAASDVATYSPARR